MAEKKDEKKVESNGSTSFGVYIKNGDSSEKVKDGFSNAVTCERWIKNNIDSVDIHSEEIETFEFVILSLRKTFNVNVETKKTVRINEM